MPSKMPTKPPKPYKTFPLTPHNNGRWCKKVKGRIVYFGKWADDPTGEKALAQYLAERDDLHAGRRPRSKDTGELKLKDALNAFLSAKLEQQNAGELAERGYNDYVRVCDIVADSIGKHRTLSDIDHIDLDKVRAALAVGKRGEALAPNTLTVDLQRARSIFAFANEHLLDKPIKYKRPLKSPPARLIRQAANKLGPRMFEAAELRTIIEAARPKMRAVIYLGINCAFGPKDCLALTHDKLDLAGRWVNHPRPKTHTLRRAPLWPETVAALQNVGSERYVIAAYSRANNCALSNAFRKLMEKLGMYRKQVTTLYSLRRTFETVAATTGDQLSIDMIMGHAAEQNDMAAVYRQKVYDAGLLKVSNHVRDWLQGRVAL